MIVATHRIKGELQLSRLPGGDPQQGRRGVSDDPYQVPPTRLVDVSDPCKARALRRAIEQAIQSVFGVDEICLFQRNRGRAPIAFARQVAMYLAHVSCRLSLADVGRMFDRDRTTVAHACAVVEDRRDHEAFDHAIELLEWVIPSLLEPHGRSPTDLSAPLLAASP